MSRSTRPGGFALLPAVGILLLLACSETPTTPEASHEAAAPRADREEPVLDIAGPGEPFDDLAMFLEFNSTDDDLGVQLFIDADGWDRLTGWSPDRNQVLQIIAKGQLGELGLTELRFESAEPSPAEVLEAFPSGEYRFAARSVEEGKLAGVAELSHTLPPAPVFTPADGDQTDPDATLIAWDPIGGLAGYEVIVENEESGLSMTVRLGPEATSLTVPPEFMESDAEYKAEVLAIAENGNKTITEHTFSTQP